MKIEVEPDRFSAVRFGHCKIISCTPRSDTPDPKVCAAVGSVVILLGFILVRSRDFSRGGILNCTAARILSVTTLVASK